MQHPGFYERAGPFALDEVARACQCQVGLDGESGTAGRHDRALVISDVLPLDLAQSGHVAFLDNRKYLAKLSQTQASACFIAPDLAGRAPVAMVPLVTKAPYIAFARALTLFYPSSGLPRTTEVLSGEGPIHPTAEIGPGVVIEHGAVIGREARIGAGTRIASGAVVGYRCWIGRDGYIGPNASVTHAVVGDRVILHAGVRVGQDGFGFAMGPGGHLKVPQIGGVRIGDDVEVGANSAIDRGALKDTVIGQGTKIDNLVQIGHNVVVGRHCVIVGQVAIAGSTELEDFVVMGGQSGAAGHIKIGKGAQIAGTSAVKDNVPAGERWAGTPAKPLREYAREAVAIRTLSNRKKG
jgi:UDP-3-O-[3-hydroxymyristoyl] glucosamine N-acyltransferase